MNNHSKRSFTWILWTLALVGIVLDQSTKYGVFKWLYYDEQRDGEYVVVPGAFKLLAQFTRVEAEGEGLLHRLRTWSSPLMPKVNHGALFGLGDEYDSVINIFGQRVGANGVFAVVSIIAAIAIVYWSTRRSTAEDGCLCAALGLILAGTLGNLYDRLIFNGVRDFLYFHWIEWPVFNVADCCLVCGAGLLLLQAFCTQPAAARAEASARGEKQSVPSLSIGPRS